MSAPSIDARVLEALQQASSLELYQLSTVIERLLADPRRILAVRKDLHLGQTVRFMDWRDGSLREGKIVAMRDKVSRAGHDHAPHLAQTHTDQTGVGQFTDTNCAIDIFVEQVDQSIA